MEELDEFSLLSNSKKYSENTNNPNNLINVNPNKLQYYDKNKFNSLKFPTHEKFLNKFNKFKAFYKNFNNPDTNY